MILEYLKVILAWPVLTSAMVLLLVPMFRRQIGSKLDRLIEGRAGSVLVKFEPVQAVGDAPPAPPAADDDHLTRIANNPVEARAEILKWWTAAVSESIFHKIYGTQMRLLERVALAGNAGVPLSELNGYFEEHLRLAEQNPNFKPGTSEQFHSFLIASSLIVITGQGGNTVAQITPLGREFLAYVTRVWGPLVNNKAF